MFPLRSVLILVTVLLLAGLPREGYCQPASVLHKNFAERYRYVDSLRICIIEKNSNPVEAQKALDDWIEDAQKQNDEALAYQLKMSAIYTNLSQNKAWLEKNVLNDIIKAKQKGYILEAADGYHILSEWIYNNGNSAKGIEYALLSYDLSKDVLLKDFPPKVKNIYRLASWYYLYKEYKKTIHYLLELKKQDSNSLFTPDAKYLNTLALAYRASGHSDSAIYYLNIIYQNEQGIINKDARAIAAGNIGMTYRLQGNYAEAIKWIKRELELSRLGKNRDNVSSLNAYVVISEIYINIGQKADAQIYLDSAKQLRPHIKDFNRLYNYFSAYASILRANGLYRQALMYTDSLLVVKDSIDASTSLSKVLEAEKHIALLKRNAEMETLRHERQKSIWVRNLLIVFIIFVSVLTLMFINRSRLKHKQKELELEYKKNKAEATLSAYTTTLHEKNLQLVQLTEELEELNSEEDIEAKNEMIRQLQRSTILTDEQWDDFRDIFEQVHSGFIGRIKEHFLGITPGEIRYITLVKLNLTTKEMANILGVNSSTVRNYKSRMKRKFTISDAVDFEDMLRKI